LRRSVIFGRSDLVQDAPISRVDLLTCRNTLMYFTAETQARILARLHYALDDGGLLFLGRAEMLLSHTDLFAPLDPKTRIFTKVPKANLRERLLVLANARELADGAGPLADRFHLRQGAMDAVPVAQVVIDSSGVVALANQRARDVLDVGADDVG